MQALSTPAATATTAPAEPKVWVRSRTRHTPGHAAVSGTPTPNQRNVTTACRWRPEGGYLINTRQALDIGVLPCRKCFPTNL